MIRGPEEREPLDVVAELHEVEAGHGIPPGYAVVHPDPEAGDLGVPLDVLAGWIRP